jgi:hypothetical protein
LSAPAPFGTEYLLAVVVLEDLVPIG